MIHLKEQTSGIDCEIQDMQQDIYNALVTKYGFKNVEAYGRLYKNETTTGVFPQWFEAGKNNYVPVYLDDTKDVTVSFIDGNEHTTKDGIVYVAPVKIVFWFNLDKITDGDGKYRDAEAQRIASTILNKDVYTTYTHDRMQKGLRSVYSGFNVNEIKFDDRNPYHIFSLNINLTYRLTKKCT